MLLACSTCHRQYDVGALPPGTRVRCRCETINTVPAAQKRQVRMLHCADCGGRLESEEATCPWCEAETHPTERDRRDPCPSCSTPLVEGAQYCGACGVKIAPEAILRAVIDCGCPRCKKPLHVLKDQYSEFHQCLSCNGIWLSKETYAGFMERHGRAAESLVISKTKAARFPTRGRRSKADPDPYVNCPVCTRYMMRRQVAGIRLDHCPAHGTWFDADELHDMGRFVASGGLLRASRRSRGRMNIMRRRRSRRRSAARRAHSLNRNNHFTATLIAVIAAS